MSRMSELTVAFTTTGEEKALANELASAFREILSVDNAFSDESGITLECWSSEHYFLADVTPVITCIVASLFPDKTIEATGRGEYTVVDDIHEYGATYSPEADRVESRWSNYCLGLNEDYGTKYSVDEAVLDTYYYGKLKECAEKMKLQLLGDKLDAYKAERSISAEKQYEWFKNYNAALATYLHARDPRDLVIPKKLDAIPPKAFMNCSMESLSIAEGVKKIGQKAFMNCKNVGEIVIPASVESISDEAFAGCTSLERIEFKNDAETLQPSLLKDCTSLRSVIFTGHVKTIKRTFQGLPNLEQVVLPEGLEELGDNAFADCVSLTDINLPKSLKSVSSSAFKGCSKLNLTLPSGLQEKAEFQVSNDMLLKAVKCVQSSEEAKDLLYFFDSLNKCKQFKKLSKAYEAEPWYKEYRKQLEEYKSKGGSSFSSQLQIKEKYFKMTFVEYAKEYFDKFVQANSDEEAMKLVSEEFTGKEIEKNNKALTAAVMTRSGRKSKDIVAEVGISSSVMSAVNMKVPYTELGSIVERMEKI